MADETDSDRYSAGKAPPDEADIRGYRPPDGHEPSGDPDIRGYPDAEESPSPADIEGYPEFPLFSESGFESLDDYLDQIEDIQRARQGLPPRLPKGMRHIKPHDGYGSRVGLRLPQTEFRQLQELGDTYGLAPATLARMIVVRAVRSGRLEPE